MLFPPAPRVAEALRRPTRGGAAIAGRRLAALLTPLALSVAVAGAAWGREPGPESVPPAVESADLAAPYSPPRARLLGFPVVGYTPETSLAFAALGMVQFHTRSGGPGARVSTASAAASYTLKNQWLVQVSPTVYLSAGETRLFGDLTLKQWNRDFFGLGNTAELEAREEYVPRELGGAFGAWRAVGDPRLALGGRYRVGSVDLRRVSADGLLVALDPIGVAGGITSALAVGASWDSRDSEFFPLDGAYVELWLERAGRRLGSDFDFGGVELDARVYRGLGASGHHVLCGQIRTAHMFGDVPFYELQTIGGMNLLRGVTDGRFIALASTAAQAEYRTPFVGRLGFVVFAGAGEVYDSLSDLEVGGVHWGAGGGLRLAVDRENGVNARLDYGVSRDEFSGVYLSVTEAF